MKTTPLPPAAGPIIALAGRRIDALDAPERFPLRNAHEVAERIRAFLAQHRALALVSSAACGADLLAQRLATDLGFDRRIVLPFPPDRFRDSSVTDRPGNWGPLYDEILRITPPAAIRVLYPNDEPDDAYAAVNAAILEDAEALARRAPAGAAHPILAVVVWEGAPRGADDLTADFAAKARARGIPVSEILTTSG